MNTYEDEGIKKFLESEDGRFSLIGHTIGYLYRIITKLEKDIEELKRKNINE